MSVRAFLCYGQGGAVIGPMLALGDGPKLIAAKLKQLGIAVSLHEWDDGAEIAHLVRKTLPPTTKVIIGGTSLGANESPHTALLCKRPIDLIFGIQPSNYGVRNQIPKNVKLALCFYNPIQIMTGGLGGYSWSRASDNHETVLKTWQTWAGHPGDMVPWIHETILAEAKKLT